MWVTAGIILLAFNTLTRAEPSRTVFTTITSDSEEFDISYPDNIHSERELPICKLNAACSVLHRRFWFKIKLERLCRCPNQYQCPREWSQQHHDNRTMMLNNRSQFKFCQIISNLSTCGPRDLALTVSTNRTKVTVSYNRSAVATFVSVVAYCNCSPENYWKLHRQGSSKNNKTTTRNYRCTKLRKCNTGEFCGNIRADHYSAFYQCSCPIGHWCIFTNSSLQPATELLYNGPAYKGVCYLHTPPTRRPYYIPRY
ncbi:U-scoloptoxin(11)-Ssd2a [Anabrus simplex]|uniref:U-scoloptoxin(11)-Ssd2a n=1 Tax=Anabrus simplex TaxID=316456 RepID=UPI0035A38468